VGWADLGKAGEDLELEVEDLGTSWKSSILEVVVRRSRAASASDWLSFCFETSLARSFSAIVSIEFRRARLWNQGIPANARPLSNDFWLLSRTKTGTPAALAATSAIPRPLLFRQPLYVRTNTTCNILTICPAPMTPNFLISVACASASLWLLELNWRHTGRVPCLGRLRVRALEIMLVV
jgi:hypothetical protein